MVELLFLEGDTIKLLQSRSFYSGSDGDIASYGAIQYNDNHKVISNN